MNRAAKQRKVVKYALRKGRLVPKSEVLGCEGETADSPPPAVSPEPEANLEANSAAASDGAAAGSANGAGNADQSRATTKVGEAEVREGSNPADKRAKLSAKPQRDRAAGATAAEDSDFEIKD